MLMVGEGAAATHRPRSVNADNPRDYTQPAGAAL